MTDQIKPYHEYLARVLVRGTKMHESAIKREMEKLFKADGRPIPAEFARAISSALQQRCETSSEYKKRAEKGGWFIMHGDGYWSLAPPPTLDELA